MKKFLSVILCIVLTVMTVFPVSFALGETETLTAKSVKEALEMSGNKYPIVFVTGIGQTFSYFIDEDSENVMYLNGEKYNYSSNSNLFLLDKNLTNIFSDIFGKIGDGTASAADIIAALKDIRNNKIIQNTLGTTEEVVNFVKVIDEVIVSITTGNYCVDYDSLCMLARGILHDNIIDENGKLPEYIISATHECPVSEFEVNPDGTENPNFGKGRFYRDIPCRDIVEDIGEDRLFCYNYAPFGYLSNISAGLDHLINDVILGEDGYFPEAKKVVLVPMSMGAAMVSQYLYDCEKAGKDPNVARVVSIVGCWDGSDVMADLIERKYAENSAEQFYTRWSLITGDKTTGTVLNNIWRLFRHDALSQLVTDVLGAMCDEVILKTPSMLALIPSDRYEAIRNEYLTKPGKESVLEQLDKYHAVQCGLKDRMEKLNSDYGTEFYFLSGYGLNLGGGYEEFPTTRDNYSFFGFLYSSNKVNSDEIIPIQSTAPGTTWVKAGESFSEEYIESARLNSTDGYIDPFSASIDVSTCYYPDHTWTFYKQIHQLDNNNTALKLAFKIASGKINSVKDCPEIFPQFNDSRDLRLIKNNINWLDENILRNNSVQARSLVGETNAYISKAYEIMDSTINHRDEEELFSAELSAFRTKAENILLGKTPEEEKPSDNSKWLDRFNEFMYEVFGYNGFADLSKNNIVEILLKAFYTLLNMLLK